MTLPSPPTTSMTQRTDKLASTLHREIQQLLNRGLNDPRVRGMISITQVRVAPDLSEAVVSVSILPQRHEALTMQGLEAAATHVRSKLAGVIDLRRMPRMVFKLDHSLKRQAAFDAALAADGPNPVVESDESIENNQSEETAT